MGQIGSAARYLCDLGIQRDDRVALVLPNGPEMATAFISVMGVATAAPLNPDTPASELAFVLQDLGVKRLIVLEDDRSPAAEVAEERSIPVSRIAPLLDQSAGDPRSGRRCPWSPGGLASPEDVALVLHTSATTARPKVVPLTTLISAPPWPAFVRRTGSVHPIGA